jgi:trans-2,3-dihydro-3-hydroxyanthranilate isomerase
MRTYQYVTADVFTDRQFGGNPLAVLLDARGLTSEEMLAITREFNYSETTFVLPAERDGDVRVRIFTPGGEIPFAGHPTVGTAHVLFAVGALRADAAETRVVLEENVGDVPVTLRFAGGDAALGGAEPSFAQLAVAQLPEERGAPDAAALARVLSLDESDFVGSDWAPVTASCGLPFVIAPLRTRDAVGRARVNLDVWERTFAPDAWSREIMVVAMDPSPSQSSGSEQAAADARARVFVPGLSVPEDPATGSANAALAGFLARRTPRLDGTLRWVVEQGVEMGRPSRLELEADKRGGEIVGVRVGGSSVVVSRGELRLR